MALQVLVELAEVQATREPLETLETRGTMAQQVTAEPLVVQVTPEIRERLATLGQAAAVAVAGVVGATILVPSLRGE